MYHVLEFAGIETIWVAKLHRLCAPIILTNSEYGGVEN